jgi:dTDP-4-amino-4,6-dideoxygalactose transaminase
MKVPILDLEEHHASIRHEILEAIGRVAAANTFILGKEVSTLEERIATYCKTTHAIGVSSGTDALLVALMALDIKLGDEVITPTYSFFATAGAVARLGAKLVLVDIDPVTYNLDPEKVKAAITPRTKCIIPVHLYGQVAEMKPLLDLAGQHGLQILEDAAQAIGAEYSDGRRAGSMGIIGCLSFFPSKNLGAWGDGGMVVTNDAALAEKLRILRAHGSKPKYYHKMIGGNFRLDSLQAAVLNVKLPHLDRWTRQRQENAARYEQLFEESGLLRERKISLPQPVYKRSGVKHHHIYNQFVIRAQERDRLRAYLGDAGIGTEIYYPVPFHLQECFQSLGYGPGAFPEAERAARETVALPIYPELTAAQQEHVVSTILKFYRA